MGHGLIHPRDLEAWHRWQGRQQVLRRLKHSLLRTPSDEAPTVTVAHGGPDADIVVLVDALHASMARAVLDPLALLPPERVITVAGPAVEMPMSGTSRTVPLAQLGQTLGRASVLVGCGEFTGAGAVAWPWARATGAATFVVQHGALTPFTPPLPSGSHLLAFSEADGDYWRAGRSDVTAESVGSQLLWRVGNSSASLRPATQGDWPLTYLGQGHGAELQRSRLRRAAATFCREHEAIYRPHPSEKDKVSRLTHAAFRRAGITVDNSRPLADLTNPVVSVFSTGILEAAAQGRDAWVDFPRPPGWLEEFWERYGMHRFGDSPTPAPAHPEVEPARRIAEILLEAAR